MSITNFFTNQEIFITGGSGFIGKALIEKLLRSFPDVGKIYVLLRSKKDKTADERLKDILNSSVFERVRQEQPQTFVKVFAIDGDCQELGLGINAKELDKLKNVNLIFHSAASVRFDDNLKSAILLNTRGTHELVKIATNLKKLKAFIHISTAYSNVDKIEVEEKLYPAHADWRTTIKLAETYDIETLNIFFPKYSSDQPNTYTFTKSLAENVINDYRHQLPIMIFRPSIVVCSVEEPFPGWVDNFNGPIGLLMASGIGIVRTCYANNDIIADFIPVDVTVRSMLIAAFKLSTQTKIRTNNDQLEVINCTNNKILGLSLKEIIDIGKRAVMDNPLEKSILKTGGSVTSCAAWHYLRFYTIQIGLAIVFDTFLRLSKQKPLLLKLQRRIHAANMALFVFMTKEWKFCNENFKALEKLIPPEDVAKLGFLGYSNLDKKLFISNGICGAKQFLMNEPPVASRKAKLRLKLLCAIDVIFKMIFIILVGKVLFRFIQTTSTT